CKRLQDFERKGIRRTGNVIFLSNEEAAYARREYGDLRSITIPPVFDYEPWRGPRSTPGSILEIGFLGNLGWWPNQLGLRWFINEVLPHVNSPIRLNLFGPHTGRGLHRDRRIVG